MAKQTTLPPPPRPQSDSNDLGDHPCFVIAHWESIITEHVVGWTAAPSKRGQRLFFRYEGSSPALVLMLRERGAACGEVFSRPDVSAFNQASCRSSAGWSEAWLTGQKDGGQCANVCQTAWALGLNGSVPRALSESAAIIIINHLDHYHHYHLDLAALSLSLYEYMTFAHMIMWLSLGSGANVPIWFPEATSPPCSDWVHYAGRSVQTITQCDEEKWQSTAIVHLCCL